MFGVIIGRYGNLSREMEEVRLLAIRLATTRLSTDQSVASPPLSVSRSRRLACHQGSLAFVSASSLAIESLSAALQSLALAVSHSPD